MAYTINGKVYTDHPLMDEMVFYLDHIMKYIEIKDDELALKYESKESLTESDTFMSITAGDITFDTFPFTIELFRSYGFTTKECKSYMADRDLIPKQERSKVLKFCCDKFLKDYEEMNNYYRTLIGLPWLDEFEKEDEYYVYLEESDVPPEPYFEGLFDFSLPLHKYTNYQIAVLNTLGVMEDVYERFTGIRYKYLHFLGDRRLDLFDVRRAAKWDILYIPSVEIMVSDRFKQLYQANRLMFLHRFYNEAYKIGSDYYDEFMIILLLCQTYTDMIADIPEWFVRRDVFDLRTCQYFLESHGIEFFKVIPLKYQVRIVKNMNKLIRYKSTNKNIWDIINLFTVDNTTVYKYYLFKKRIANEEGSYAHGKDPADEYELEFVKAPIGTSYDDTIKNRIYREPYDDITYRDKWWDGEDTHENIKALHLAKDFTIEGTKYISLESRISMSEYAYQVEYFIGLLLDSDMELEDILINIPTISPVISFPLSDLFILLYLLTASYDDIELLIRTPINMRTKEKAEFEAYDDYDGGRVYTRAELEINGGGPEVQNKFRMPVDGGEGPEYTEITQETYYDWLRWKHPHVWADMSARIYGFNMNADLDELAEMVGFRHSSFRFTKGWTLEELGVAGFQTKKNIKSIDELVRIYQVNTEIHDSLKEKILNAETRDERVVFEFVFDYLFTRKYDYKRYTLRASGELAVTYDEILREKNYILYNYFKSMSNERDIETRKDMIRGAMNDIISTLEYYLNFDCLKYIFSIFTISSFTNVLYYIYLMINFFKSYKVYFLDTYVTFLLDNRLENTVMTKDQLAEIKLNYWKWDSIEMRDSVSIHTYFDKADRLCDNTMEVLEIYGYYEPDPNIDLDLVGDNIGEGYIFRDLDGGPPSKQEYLLDINGHRVIDYIKEIHQPIPYCYIVEGGSPSLEIELDDHSHGPWMYPKEFRNIDGGGVPVSAHAPYYMFNGGRVGAGKFLFDLDGNSAQERFDYIDVDGTEVETEKEIHIPHQSFSFDIDGGHPSMGYYLTKSMVVRVTDNQINVEVSLAHSNNSKYQNQLEIKSDGLYLEDKYADAKEYTEIKAYYEGVMESYRSYYNEACNIVHLVDVTLSQDLESMAIELTQDYFNKALRSFNNFKQETDRAVTVVKGYTNRKLKEFEEYFKGYNQSLFGWGRIK